MARGAALQRHDVMTVAAAAAGVPINRQWVLQRRPNGVLQLEDFALRQQPRAEPELAPGQIWVRNLVFSCAPTIRNWMNESTRSYRAAIALGEPIAGPACARILRTANERFALDSHVIGISSWQDYSIIDAEKAAVPVLPVPADLPVIEALGTFGFNSLTAYFGLLKIGQPNAGETVVVSAAAGSVGSVAAQIGKIKGCRVIGIAGGRQKCEWLLRVCRLDAAIDYQNEDIDARLKQHAPDGVNIFFDNVGGPILAIVTEHMAPHGRIVVCGQVAAYDSDRPAPGPPDMMRIVYGRLKVQGFVTGDYCAEADQARAEVAQWRRQERLVIRHDVRRGFENLPASLIDVFRGANAGALLVSIADAN